MTRRVIREDTVSHERWMVSYADFLTLLLAFFVVMYAVSQRDESKFRVLSQTLTKAFNIPPSTIDPIQRGDPVTAVMPGVVPDATQSPEQQPESGRTEEQGQRATTSEPQLPEEFRRISERVEKEFAGLVASGLLSVRGNEEWLEIELRSSLLFASGEASIGTEARPILRQLADAVRDSALPIRVEGFTDDRPIATGTFPSNWELSSARAATIVKLLTQFGIAPTRLAAIGYGEFQPVASNASEAGRARNRRVVLMLSRSALLRPELPRTRIDEAAAMAVPAEAAAPAAAAAAPAAAAPAAPATATAAVAPGDPATAVRQPGPDGAILVGRDEDSDAAPASAQPSAETR